MAKKKAEKKKTSKAKRAPAEGAGGVVAGLQEFCRTLPGTTEDVKWEDNLIFSVGGKMYAGFDLSGGRSFAFKCDDIDFERLTKMSGIIPAPYAARFGWVKFERSDAIAIDKVRALVRKAHGLVLACLPKKKQAEIQASRV